MARNAGGTYTLPAGNPVVTGTVIASTWANTTLSDLAAEMTDSLDRSGKGGMLAPLLLADGAVGTPGLAFTSEPSTGLYRAAANDLRLGVAGVDAMRVTPGSAAPRFTFTSPQAGAGTQTDFLFNTTNARTAGLLLDVQTASASKFKVDFAGAATAAGSVTATALTAASLTALAAGRLLLTSNLAAADADTDFLHNTVAARTAGLLLDLQNNGISIFKVAAANSAVTTAGPITCNNGAVSALGSGFVGSSLTALAAGSLSFTSNLAGGDAGIDFTLVSANTRTAGNLLRVVIGASLRANVNFDGILSHGFGLVASAGTAPIRVPIAADVTCSSSTVATNLGPSLAVKSGKTYRIHGRFRAWSSVVTTGFGIGIKSTGAPTTTLIAISHQHWGSAGTLSTGNVTNVFGDTPLVYPDALTTTAGVWDTFDAVVTTSSTGTIQLLLITEVNASTVTVGAGSWFEITED